MVRNQASCKVTCCCECCKKLHQTRHLQTYILASCLPQSLTALDVIYLLAVYQGSNTVAIKQIAQNKTCKCCQAQQPNQMSVHTLSSVVCVFYDLLETDSTSKIYCSVYACGCLIKWVSFRIYYCF